MKVYYKPEEILVLCRSKKDYFIHIVDGNECLKYGFRSRESMLKHLNISYEYVVNWLDLL